MTLALKPAPETDRPAIVTLELPLFVRVTFWLLVADDTVVKGHAGGAGGQNKRSPVHGEGEGLGGVRQHTVAGRKSNRIIPGSAQHAAAESHSRGRAPDWLIDGGGVPAVVTVNNPPEPTVKVALEEPASNGATEGGFTVSVTVLLVTFPTLLLTSTAKDASVSEVLLAAVVYEKDVAPLMATLVLKPLITERRSSTCDHEEGVCLDATVFADRLSCNRRRRNTRT